MCHNEGDLMCKETHTNPFMNLHHQLKREKIEKIVVLHFPNTANGYMV